MYIKAEKLVGWWMVSLLSVTSFATSTSDLGLVEAAKNQNKDVVRSLLKQHADADATHGDGSTALHWAAHWDDPETTDLLVRAGANVNTANDLGVTPLYLACTNGSAAMVEKLLAAGANPNAVAATGVSPLMRAARSGSLNAVKALLAHGAKINLKENSGGQTALMWAVAQRHPEVVQVLVEHGADVDARSRSSSWLVNIRGIGEDEEGPSKVIQMGGSTALLFAARQGCIECARVLLDGGANVNDAAPDGNSALVLAAHSGEGALAAFLLDKGANPNTDGAGYTAMHAAVLRGDLELVKALLAHGANPNARLANGTPMRRSGPDFALSASLVGATPFLLAAKYASVDMMRVLAAIGADPKLAANDGTTPLMAAAGATHRTGGLLGTPPEDESRVLEAVKLTLDLGANVNVANQVGDSALHIAASGGFDTVVQLLAEWGAELNVKNKHGQTPLALTMLLRHSSNLKRPSPFKSTADLLRKLGATE